MWLVASSEPVLLLSSPCVQLYNAYSECQMQLELEKQETRRVSRVLDEVVQEVESKAPVLKHQREEYETMQRSMASMCNKLEQARMVGLHVSYLSSSLEAQMIMKVKRNVSH